MTSPPETETPPALCGEAAEGKGEQPEQTMAEPEAGSKARHTSASREAPYCWQSKPALLRLTNGEFGNPTPILATYVVLCWLASDRQSSTFEARIYELCRKSGLSTRTVQGAIKALVHAKLITIEYRRDGKTNLPSRFTILSVKPAPKGAATIAPPLPQPVHEDSRNQCGTTTAKEEASYLRTLEEVEEGSATSALPSSQKKRWKAERHRSRSGSLPLRAERPGAGGASAGERRGLDKMPLDAETAAWVAEKGGQQ